VAIRVELLNWLPLRTTGRWPVPSILLNGLEPLNRFPQSDVNDHQVRDVSTRPENHGAPSTWQALTIIRRLWFTAGNMIPHDAGSEILSHQTDHSWSCISDTPPQKSRFAALPYPHPVISTGTRRRSGGTEKSRWDGYAMGWIVESGREGEKVGLPSEALAKEGDPWNLGHRDLHPRILQLAPCALNPEPSLHSQARKEPHLYEDSLINYILSKIALSESYGVISYRDVITETTAKSIKLFIKNL